VCCDFATCRRHWHELPNFRSSPDGHPRLSRERLHGLLAPVVNGRCRCVELRHKGSIHVRRSPEPSQDFGAGIIDDKRMPAVSFRPPGPSSRNSRAIIEKFAPAVIARIFSAGSRNARGPADVRADPEVVRGGTLAIGEKENKRIGNNGTVLSRDSRLVTSH
jgi:hypothetical protein